jgi:hypothetical protein
MRNLILTTSLLIVGCNSSSLTGGRSDTQSDREASESEPAPGRGDSVIQWNPLDRSPETTLSNDNLTASTAPGDGIYNAVRATKGKRSGRWYWEIEIDEAATDYWAAGVGFSTGYGDDPEAPQPYGCELSADGGAIHCQNYPVLELGGLNTFTQGDVFGLALDLDSHQFYMRRNGTWLIDPTGPGIPVAHDRSNPTYYPRVFVSEGDQYTANFAGPFSVPPPNGFEPITGDHEAPLMPLSSLAFTDCDGSSSTWSGAEDGTLRVVGLYEAKVHEGMGEEFTGVVNVAVSDLDVRTIALNSYGRVRWNIDASGAPGLERILIHGYERQRTVVSGTELVPEILEAGTTSLGNSLPDTDGGTERMLQYYEAVTGSALKTFDGCYAASTIVLN